MAVVVFGVAIMRFLPHLAPPGDCDYAVEAADAAEVVA